MEKVSCDFLSKVPHERTREYELSLTNYVLENNSPELRAELERITAEHSDPQIAYNAFYCLNIIYRRAKDYFKVSKLFSRYTQKFAKHITFEHLKVLFEIESGSMYDYDEVLNVTYKDSELFNDNAGFVHLFADVFITIYENGHIRDKEAFLNEWYQLALGAVNKAIMLDENYAKYYCTKARILCVVNEFDEAINYINKAISIERSDRRDYTLRICNYQYYKMMINMNKKLFYMIESGAFSANAGALAVQNAFSEAGVPVIAGSPVAAGNPAAPKSAAVGKKPKAYRGKAPYAFISYSHVNSIEAYNLIALLQRNGVKTWFDEGIDVGVEYAEFIAGKLSGSSAFIILITPDAVNSEFVRKELQMAMDLKMKPICVYLKETMLSPGMMIHLNIYEHIKYYETTEADFLARIIPAINNKLEANKR